MMKKYLLNQWQKLSDWYFWNFTIKGDEFHSSLDLDHRKMLKMNKEQRTLYLKEIIMLRERAHRLDIENSKGII